MVNRYFGPFISNLGVIFTTIQIPRKKNPVRKKKKEEKKKRNLVYIFLLKKRYFEDIFKKYIYYIN